MATYYWVGGDGTWDNANTANWSNASGGSSGFGPPTSSDTAIFDSASGTGTCTTAATAAVQSITLNTSTLTLKLGANLTAIGTFTLTLGALDLNNNALSFGVVSSNNSNTRSIAFGTGSITVTSSSANVWQFTTATGFTYTGTPNVYANYSGSVGTRGILHGTTGATITNTPNFYVTAGTDTVSLNSANIFDCTGFSGALNFSNNSNHYGNFTLSSGCSVNASTNTFIFAATSTQTITTNGKTIDQPVTFNGVGGTFQLQDNMTVGSTRTVTLTNGTLDLNNLTLSTGVFSSSNSNARSIAFGTGNITCTNSGVQVVVMNQMTNFTYTGTSNIICNYAGSTGTRTIRVGNSGGASETNALSVYVTAGSDALSNAGFFKNLDFTGYSGALTVADSSTVYGNLTFGSGMSVVATTNSFALYATSGTQLVTTNNVTIDAPFFRSGVGATVQLQDNFTIGSTRTFNLLSGGLNLNGKNLTAGIFASSNTSVRSITSGAGQFYVTGNSATVFTIANDTNLTLADKPTVNATYAGSTGTRTISGGSSLTAANAININVTAGSDTITLAPSSNYTNIDFTGFSGTFSNSVIGVYGNYTLSSGMTLTSGANATNFEATSGTKQITTNNKTLDFPITFNGVGGTFEFQDALTMGSTRALTLTNGTVKLKAGVTSTVGSFATSGTNQKYLQSTLAGSQATLSDASGTNSLSYTTIQDIFATGGATWNAYYANGNIDGGNNTNWNFGGTPSYDAEYGYKLRSFTETGRF